MFENHSFTSQPTMANTAHLLICFSFIIFSRSVLSRTLISDSETTVLDVNSEIQKTVGVFSINSQATKSLQDEKKSLHFDSQLSLELHPRVSIHQVSQNDYKSLTVARLSRDSSRVQSLQTRVDLVVHGISRADLVSPMETQLGVEALEGPVISGTSQGSGEYFSRVGIGHPPCQVYMVLDTGSDVNWLQCTPCADCYQQADPIFQPASSSSYAALTCQTQQCRSLDVSECRNNTCMYEVSYGDGSYTVGEFVTETITFGGPASVNKIAIGCGHNNEGLFVGAAGLLGFGGGSLSFPSQINASAFSYCLVNRDSDATSTVDINSGTPPDAVTAPLLRNSKLGTFYYVDITGLSVAGEAVQIPPSSFKMGEDGDGGVIVDSGTAVTRLATPVYNALRDAFVKGTKNLPSTNGFALFDTCYDLSSRKSVEVPTVSFHFSNGNELALPAKNYLIPVDSAGTFCFAFAPTTTTLSIIGNIQQQGTRVSFDLANSLIGFTSNKC